MPRAIWSGTISFGLVSIPVGIFPATHPNDVSFHQIHKESGTRISYVKYCPTCERAVQPDEIERGYEFEKGKYVMVSDDELKKLPVPSQRTIEIVSFIKAEEIDPVYFDASYYVEPEKGGKKPYALLWKAIEAKGLVGLAKIALRTKEHLCVLRVSGKHLVLETLFYEDEIREAADLSASDLEVSDKEMKVAESLVDLLTDTFKPEEFHDTYREALMELIDAKVKGHKVKEIGEAPAPTKVVDLMEALKASIESAKRNKAG